MPKRSKTISALRAVTRFYASIETTRTTVPPKRRHINPPQAQGIHARMYRMEVKHGKKGQAGQHKRYQDREEHYAYIAREGRFEERGDLELSESGNMPEWATNDPTVFWDMADRYERANGRTYTEIVFSLPRELSAEQRVELAREFVQNVLGERHAYSWAIHSPLASDGLEQPHVHLMFSERVNDGIERDPEKFFSRYNATNPEQGGAGKDRYFNTKAFVREVREEWAITANHFMSRHGIEARIDHRSYKTLGIELEPTRKVGIAKYAGERVAMAETLAQNREIAKRNGDRLLLNPAIGVHALSTLNSIFSRHDVEQFVFRNTDSADQYQQVLARMLNSKELLALAAPGKEGEWFTSAELRAVETRLVSRAERMAGIEVDPVAAATADQVRDARNLKPAQLSAFELLVGNRQLGVVNGAAGTGKSYVMGAAREAFESEGFRVLGAALQGKTAEDMQRDAGISSRTLASFLTAIEKGHLTLDPQTVVFIDEAGMVGSRQLEKLLGHAETNGARVRLVGDAWQLHAVEAGDAFRAVSKEAENAGALAGLTEIVRQNDDWQREASVALSRHDVSTALNAYIMHGSVFLHESLAAASDGLVAFALEARDVHPEDSQLLIAHTNAQRTGLNTAMRAALSARGELSADQPVSLVAEVDGERSVTVIPFAVGERVVFGRNDYGLDVRNGTLGVIEGIASRQHDGATQPEPGSLLSVRLDSGKHIVVDTGQYADLDYGYALTIHKSQGVTVDRAYLLATPSMNAELSYVGMTRHKKELVVASGRDAFDDAKSLVRGLSKPVEKAFSAAHDVRPVIRDNPEYTHRQTFAKRREIAFEAAAERRRDRSPDGLRAELGATLAKVSAKDGPTLASEQARIRQLTTALRRRDQVQPGVSYDGRAWDALVALSGETRARELVDAATSRREREAAARYRSIERQLSIAGEFAQRMSKRTEAREAAIARPAAPVEVGPPRLPAAQRDQFSLSVNRYVDSWNDLKRIQRSGIASPPKWTNELTENGRRLDAMWPSSHVHLLQAIERDRDTQRALALPSGKPRADAMIAGIERAAEREYARQHGRAADGQQHDLEREGRKPYQAMTPAERVARRDEFMTNVENQAQSNDERERLLREQGRGVDRGKKGYGRGD